jgi:type IV pilus assembly protein PilZ
VTEHREHPRAPIELKVDYRRLNSFFADYTKNISKGGTFIKTRKALPVGTRFLFQLSIPGRDQAIELSGEVVHASATADQAGMGIRFVWEDDAQRQQFEALVEQLMVESLGPDVAHRLLRHSQGGES